MRLKRVRASRKDSAPTPGHAGFDLSDRAELVVWVNPKIACAENMVLTLARNLLRHRDLAVLPVMQGEGRSSSIMSQAVLDEREIAWRHTRIDQQFVAP